MRAVLLLGLMLLAGCTTGTPNPEIMALGAAIYGGSQPKYRPPLAPPPPQRTTCRYNPVVKAVICDTF